MNVWAGGCELDLIARRGGLVFCEVKGKSGPGFGDPLEMVDEESCGGSTRRRLARPQRVVPRARLSLRGCRLPRPRLERVAV